MKSTYYSMLFALLFGLTFSACKEQKTNTPEPANNTGNTWKPLLFNDDLKPILFEITSTGCPGCGSWGKPTFAKLKNELKDKIVPLAIHIKYGDPMITAHSNEIGDNRYGSRYTPQIWVNDSNGVVIRDGFIDGNQSEQRLTYLANLPIASDLKLDGQAIKKENKIVAKYGVKTNANLPDGVYHMSYYLVEDNIMASQAPNGQSTEHNNVLRKAAEGTFGLALNQANFKEGVFAHETEFSLDNPEGNFHTMIILWKKEGTRYVAIGAKIVRLD